MNRIEKALEYHKRGVNCAQSVCCAYCDLFGVDEDTAYRLSEGFGLGMGLMEVCGALSGAFMLAGMKNSAGVENPGKTKAGTYKINREIAEAFREKNGTVLCRELKGVSDGIVRRRCDGCVIDACEFVEQFLLGGKE